MPIIRARRREPLRQAACKYLSRVLACCGAGTAFAGGQHWNDNVRKRLGCVFYSSLGGGEVRFLPLGRDRALTTSPGCGFWGADGPRTPVTLPWPPPTPILRSLDPQGLRGRGGYKCGRAPPPAPTTLPPVGEPSRSLESRAAPPRVHLPSKSTMRAGRSSLPGVPHLVPLPLLLLLLGGAVLGGAPRPARSECLADMASRADWAPCLTGDSPCWAFIAERPFVTVAPAATAAAAAARRRLFPCATAAQHGFGGDSFELLTVLGDGPSAAAPHWCVYAGDAAECTFDELLAYVDASATNGTHPAFGAAIGFLGALLSTPERAGMGFWLEPIQRVSSRGGGRRRGRGPRRRGDAFACGGLGGLEEGQGGLRRQRTVGWCAGSDCGHS